MVRQIKYLETYAVYHRIKGGMGMVNLNHFIKTKQVKCMHNIIHSELDKWNVIGKYWLTSMDSKFETDFFSVNVQISKILD